MHILAAVAQHEGNDFRAMSILPPKYAKVAKRVEDVAAQITNGEPSFRLRIVVDSTPKGMNRGLPTIFARCGPRCGPDKALPSKIRRAIGLSV